MDLLVTGGEIHALTLGRSLGFLEQALDLLAVAELEANVDRSRLLERLAPHLARLSAVVMIVDGWDEAREAFVRGVEKSGVRVHAIAVGPPANAGVKVVPVASILAGKGLVLRTLGIPARLVAGYRVVEHNGFGGYAVVRAKHAHAWGEAYVPVASGPTRSAFEVFDPTPATPTLADSSDRTGAAFFDYLWTSLLVFYDAAVATPERTVPALGGAALVAFAVRALLNRRRRGRKVEDDVDVPPEAFVQFEARLAKDGFVRDRAETLESLAVRLEVGGREPLSRALRRYARARYGVAEASERDLARALEPGRD